MRLPIFTYCRYLSLTLLFFISCYAIMAQQIITGKVLSEDTNQPLGGATVTVKGTDRITQADINGIYKVEASADRIETEKEVNFSLIKILNDGCLTQRLIPKFYFAKLNLFSFFCRTNKIGIWRPISWLNL